MEVRTKPPVDRGCLVGVAFFILGLGTLLPWNFFMTASLYFQERLNGSALANSTLVEGRKYHFNNWMTLLSQLPLLLFTLLNSILYRRVSEGVRITGSLLFILLLFTLTAVLVKVPMERDRFFSVTMATIWFINSFGAVLQGSLFGLVGLLPPRYSAVFMSGQGLAGTFAALAMLLAIGSDAGSASETAALGYFITPCVGTLVTLLSYLLLPHLEFARFYLSRSSKYEGGAEDQLLRGGDGGVQKEQANGHAGGGVAEKDPDPEGAAVAFLSVEVEGRGQGKATVVQVFKKIWVMAFCVTFVFTVTLSVFPAVTADVKTAFPASSWDRFFVTVCCFLTFNLGDWLGRTVTTFVRWPGRDSGLFPLLVVLRALLVPLLLLCNVQDRSHLPVLFHHDAAFTAIVLLFAVSSGYFVCLSMSYAPQLVEAQDGETAGALMTFFLALGLSLGAALSFPLRALV